MIRMSAEIKTAIGWDSSLDNIIDTNITYSNVSSTLYDVLNSEVTTTAPFILSSDSNTYSVFTDAHKYSNTVDYAIIKTTEKMDFTVVGEGITGLTIAFNERINCYPTSVRVTELSLISGRPQNSTNINDYTATNEYELEINDVKFWIATKSVCDGVTFDFSQSEYNKSPYTLMISGIYSDVTIYADSVNLSECSITCGINQGNTAIGVSICDYNDTIAIYDFNGEVERAIINGTIGRGSDVIVYIENTITKRRDVHMRRKIIDVRLYKEVKLCTFTIGLAASNMQDINVVLENQTRTALDVLNIARSNANVTINAPSTETAELLEANVIVQNTTNSSVWALLQQICSAINRDLAPTPSGLLRFYE